MTWRVYISVLLVSVGACDPSPGTPLYLTPYIESGRIQEARTAAAVIPLLEGLVSFSGYLTVDKQFNSNLFFWFFPSEHNWELKPVVLWLQGGPGASSLLGLLYENGPIRLTESGLIKNMFSWSQNYNVIYIDNPVGTGFSFTNSSEGYLKNQSKIGEAVYIALQQFFTLFPELSKNYFFLTGESYAGKYIPSVAHTIHKSNKKSNVKINLQGLFIGNGLVDPINMLHYSDYLYQLGLIDTNGQKLFQKYETAITQYIEASQWSHATDMFSTLIMDYYFSENFTLYNNLTGLSQHYNYINDNEGTENVQPFVSNVTIRRAIHVGENKFNNGRKAALALKEDIMQSMKLVIESLLENYKILFYNGQLDIICSYPLAEKVFQNLEWSGKIHYQLAVRRIWKVNGKLAGYIKSGGNLTEVMVRNAGHLVPSDQPEWALELLNKFVNQTTYL